MQQRKCPQSDEEIVNLARWFARRYHPPADSLLERDDLVGEAYLAILDALETYDPSRGAFTHFAGYHVRHRLRAALAVSWRGFCLPQGARGDRKPETVSLDAPVNENGITLHDLLPDTTPQADLTVLDTLPEEDRQLLWWRFVEGRTLAEIGRLVGRSSPTVLSRIRKILLLLREHL